MRVALVSALLAAAALAQQVTPVQMPAGTSVTDLVYADVNGDGRQDLVISTVDPERALRVHLQRDGEVPFVGEPDHILAPIWKDVVAYAVGDVHPDPGAEIVLFSSKAAWAWRPTAPEKERAVKLVECAFLWQLPKWHVVSWEKGLFDLDGNGLVDLVLPEPDGFRLALQVSPGEFAKPEALVVPAGPRAAAPLSVKMRTRRLRDRVELKLSIGSEEAVEAGKDTAREHGAGQAMKATRAEEAFTGALLEISDSVPAPRFLDWDADGDLDLILSTEEWLFVWKQDKGRFGERPETSLKLPVVADRARTLDVSYSSHAVDLDLDGRADCVIFSGDKRAKDVRTQVQFFKQRDKPSLFHEGMPDQLLVLAGFAGVPRLDDVNGDGYPDLAVGAVRPDLLAQLRGAGGQIEAELYIFLNRKGSFPRRPDLAFRGRIQAEGLRFSRSQVMARFFGDVSGDGVHELLWRDQDRRVRVMLTRRTRQGLEVHPQPYWELRIDPSSELRLGPSRGPRKAPDLLVLEPAQVLHVRFP